MVLSATTALCWHLEASKVEVKGLLCHLKETLCFSKALHDLRDQYLTFIWFARSFFSWLRSSFYLTLLHETFLSFYILQGIPNREPA